VENGGDAVADYGSISRGPSRVYFGGTAPPPRERIQSTAAPAELGAHWTARSLVRPYCWDLLGIWPIRAVVLGRTVQATSAAGVGKGLNGRCETCVVRWNIRSCRWRVVDSRLRGPCGLDSLSQFVEI